MSLLSFLLGSLTTAHAVPIQLSQQGRLLDSNGVAISGQHVITFSLHDSQVGGNQLWAEGLQITFNEGYYSALLGNNVSNPLDDGILASNPVYLEVDVNGTGPIGLRQEVVSAPYSRLAGTATNLSGGTVDGHSVSVGGQLVIDVSGSWVGPAMPVGWSSIQNIPGDIADGDDDTLAGIVCSSGEILGWNGSQWACAADNGLTEAEVEAFVTNGPLDLASGTTLGGTPILKEGDNGTLSGLSCLHDEIAKWDMVLGQWVCSSFENLMDSDGDGVMAWNDCDDTDPLIGANVNDQDCDGVLAADDCNDYDPNSTVMANDGDCDGISTADDCDDADPVSTALSNDADCDGAVTALDCDDSDPSVAPGMVEVCGDGIDNDCSGGDAVCQNYEFTACGSSGRHGPSQSDCDQSYQGTALAGLVSVDGLGYQTWTVPQTGLYAISAYGASGGDTLFQGVTYDGGGGAMLYGEFNLTQGQQLTLLVGQEGTIGDSSDSGGGGGGGTYVVNNGTPLIIAAGGGGATAGYQCIQYTGTQCHGRDGHVADVGEGSSNCSGSYGSCRGAGFSTDADGMSFMSGGVGGDSNYVGFGGFGGGGGAQSHPGGGGGGYFGGGCGFNFPTDDTDVCNGSNNSTGGWSHNSGSNASGTDGANEGHGYVVIAKL